MKKYMLFIIIFTVFASSGKSQTKVTIEDKPDDEYKKDMEKYRELNAVVNKSFKDLRVQYLEQKKKTDYNSIESLKTFIQYAQSFINTYNNHSQALSACSEMAAIGAKYQSTSLNGKECELSIQGNKRIVESDIETANEIIKRLMDEKDEKSLSLSLGETSIGQYSNTEDIKNEQINGNQTNEFSRLRTAYNDLITEAERIRLNGSSNSLEYRNLLKEIEKFEFRLGVREDDSYYNNVVEKRNRKDLESKASTVAGGITEAIEGKLISGIGLAFSTRTQVIEDNYLSSLNEIIYELNIGLNDKGGMTLGFGTSSSVYDTSTFLLGINYDLFNFSDNSVKFGIDGEYGFGESEDNSEQWTEYIDKTSFYGLGAYVKILFAYAGIGYGLYNGEDYVGEETVEVNGEYTRVNLGVRFSF